MSILRPSVRLPAAAARSAALGSLLAGIAATSSAASFDVNTLQNLNQGQFVDLAHDMGAAFSYKPYEPADPLGITGFDIGVAVTGTHMANTGAIQPAITGSSVYGTMPAPSVRLSKGLPDNVDLGVMYSQVPSSQVRLYGGALKWAVLPGGVDMPAVALRGAVTRIDGMSQLGMETVSADISISKGFLFATPYCGVGEVWSRVAPSSVTNLTQVNFTQPKVFAGVDMNLGIADVVVEGDSTGGIYSYGVKVGYRF
ncbi:putative uncharacterized protein [Burkholderiales bacterium GJ-E10]|nr:putative uncharacterized protein [Burkholderiales bacterium GJ-E10]